MPYTYVATIKNRVAERIGNRGLAVKVGEIDVSDYNSSLDPILEISKGFREVYAVTLGGFSDNGYAVAWDISNKSVKAFYPIAAEALAFTGAVIPPGLIVEESVTISSGVGTLAELPAYIVTIEATAGSQSIPYQIIPVGESVSTGLVAVNFLTGGLITVTAEATTMLVTYFPQRDGTMFAASNMVIDEVLVASSSQVATNSRAFAVQYLWDDTDSTLLSAAGTEQTGGMEPPGEAPSATGKAVLNINDTGVTKVDTNAADDGNSLKITYLKFAGLPSDDLFIDDTDIALNSEVYDFGADGAYDALVVPGFGTLFSGEEAADSSSAIITGPSGTAGDVEATWNPAKNLLTTNNTTAFTTTAMSWFIVPGGRGYGVTPAGTISAVTAAAAQEVANGVDIGVVTFTAWGRI